MLNIIPYFSLLIEVSFFPAVVCAMIRRLHDGGFNGYFAGVFVVVEAVIHYSLVYFIAWPVSLALAILFFAWPGNKEANDYGPSQGV